jgi:CRP/FNR family transcriptional regulator, cyclic AMP receptor protein
VSTDDLHDLLLKGAWFAHLPLAIQEELRPHLIRRRCPAGTALYRQGEAPKNMFGILSGTIQTLGTSKDGHQSLLSVLRSGEWSGFIGQLDGKPHSFLTIAATDVDVVFLPEAAVRKIFLQSPDRMTYLVLPLIEILRFAYRFLVETNGRSPRRVIAQRLIDLSHCVYAPDVPAGKMLDGTSQQDIATATYLTRPTVNRILRDFAAHGVISLGYGRIDLCDPAALRQIAQGEDRAIASTTGAPSPTAPCAKFKCVDQGTQRLEETLANSGWMTSLSKPTQRRIANALQIRRYDAGEAVCAQDETCEGLIVSLSGQLRTIGSAADGQERLVAFVHPGEWTAFAPILDNGPHAFSVIAARSSVVGILPTDAARAILCDDVQNYRALVAPTVQFLRFIYDYLIETNQGPPGRFVARRLYDLARVAYLDGSQPRDFMDSLSQGDIALATGLTRPTVNKVLKQLEAKGAIRLGYRRIKILRPDILLNHESGTKSEIA